MTDTARLSRTQTLLRHVNGWAIAVWLIAALVALPIAVVVGSIFANTGDIWAHLASTVLVQYVTNSLLLMAGVAVGVLVIGVGTAWLVTLCRFPGGHWFEWALLLPLAAPAYLLAYTYTECSSTTAPYKQGYGRCLVGTASQTIGFLTFGRSGARSRCLASPYIPTCTCWLAWPF